MKHISAHEVIEILPDDLLDTIAQENKTDRSVKKLHGKIVFKLFLYGILSCKNISLRILEAIYASEKFQKMFKPARKKIGHSGIGMRLGSIDYHYFESIFNHLVRSGTIQEIFFSKKKVNVRKIDSTLVLLSSKLLKIGMDHHRGKKAVKYSTEINQGIPVHVMFFRDQKFLCEDNALPNVIERHTSSSTLNIAIFDRGIQKRQNFVEFSQKGIYFISRLTSQGYTVVEQLEIKKKYTATLKIESDTLIKFQNSRETIEQEFRVIMGKNKETKETITFITNIRFLEATEVTDLYRSRWEIETFFKFIKQEMNFSHLLSRSENGIKVVMFLTMIAAILLTLYKKMNKVVGWVVTKIKFLDELESELIHTWHEELYSVFPKRNAIVAQMKSG